MSKPGAKLRPYLSGLFLAACLILVLQATAARKLNVVETSLPLPGLHQIPQEIGSWTATGDMALENSVTEYLKPDEYLLRNYASPGRAAPVNLFVAYFKSLQNTYGPHSPRVCLPGAGWLVSSASIKAISVPGRSDGIPVNEYVLEKSGERILVLYWYQNDRNAWAEEFQAKLRLLPDLIKYRRSDVSLVRLVRPLVKSASETEEKDCIEFARNLYPSLVERFATTR
jgi:EpsI family protein